MGALNGRESAVAVFGGQQALHRAYVKLGAPLNAVFVGWVFALCGLSRLVFRQEFADLRNKLDGNFHYGVSGGFVSGFVLGDGFFSFQLTPQVRLRFVMLKHPPHAALVPAFGKSGLLHCFLRRLRLRGFQ